MICFSDKLDFGNRSNAVRTERAHAELPSDALLDYVEERLELLEFLRRKIDTLNK
ncbi:hypothetical protein HMPREF9081_1942 [Centipeda periodontii DSM 2778]|uniref:Uncharacterized protein n=1 Tax=Centipeda periodontii DSM 2778 TaxID=888060 RepID=F5RNV6_9FIRM|nr:hypothetical protein [Centipeda periodontii]EGK58346.1 hypothetical protein HMPREF9081_1942 [Centipeda periodontii DSM 2778]